MKNYFSEYSSGGDGNGYCLIVEAAFSPGRTVQEVGTDICDISMLHCNMRGFQEKDIEVVVPSTVKISSQEQVRQ